MPRVQGHHYTDSFFSGNAGGSFSVFPGGSRGTGRRAAEQEGGLGGGGGGGGGGHCRRDIVLSSPSERDTPLAALSHGALVSGALVSGMLCVKSASGGPAAGMCGETEDGRGGCRVDDRRVMEGAEMSDSCNKRCNKSAGAEGEAEEDFVGLLEVWLRDIYRCI